MPSKTHQSEIVADSLRTEAPCTPSDLRKRGDSHVKAGLRLAVR